MNKSIYQTKSLLLQKEQKMLNANTIQLHISSGEGYNIEFKICALPIVRELTEEICAFANVSRVNLSINTH